MTRAEAGHAAPFDLRAIPPDGPTDAGAGPEPAWLDADQVPQDFAHRRRFRRPEPGPMVLNIVSMIDVIFLLMTYFLLTAQFTTREESFEVRVPERLEGAPASSAAPADPFALPVTTITLTVTSRGEGPADFVIFSESAALGAAAEGRNAAFQSYDALTLAAESARGRVLADDQRFIIRPAADAKWEHALGALNAIKRAGYNNVRFAGPARAATP